MDTETIQDRLKAYLSNKGLTMKDFESKAHLSNSTGARLTAKTRNKTIGRIAAAFPDLNTDWLLTGKGEMLQTPSVTQTVVGNNNIGNNTYNADHTATLLHIIDQQQQTIARLTELLAQKNGRASQPGRANE